MSFTWEFVAVSNMVGDPYLNRNMGLSAVLGEAGWCHRLVECCIQNCMTTLVMSFESLSQYQLHDHFVCDSMRTRRKANTGL
jgi:hypothetical protein